MSGADSRLLSSLDARIAADPDSFATDCVRAERACYRARQGRIEEALAFAAKLRERYNPRPSAVISAWVNLVEGLCRHFDDMGEPARDKLRRAHALSGFEPTSRLHLLCAAWLAHVDYAHHDAAGMAKHVRQALESASVDEHTVRSRACMVVAQALHLGTGLQRASPWYAIAHRHAVAEGDELTIAALIHNRGWLELTRVGERAYDPSGSDAIETALRALESSFSYDRMIGAASLATVAPLVRAQVLCLRGDPASALLLFDAHIGITSRASAARLASNMLADQAWCRARLGQYEAARSDALTALSSLLPSTHVDDRAATHSRLAQVYETIGDEGQRREQTALAAICWDQFRQVQRHMEVALDFLDLGQI